MNTPNLNIHNANIYTLNPQMPHAQAVVVQGNKIVFVGSNREAMALRGAKTRVIDGGSCTLLPGFNMDGDAAQMALYANMAAENAFNLRV